jgi:hypothetical protein
VRVSALAKNPITHCRREWPRGLAAHPWRRPGMAAIKD